MHAVSFKQVAAHKELERDPIGQYLASLRVENKSDRTIASYQYDLESFRQWFGLPIEQVDSVTLGKYFSELVVSPATLARKQTALAMFFRYCILMGILEKDPMAVIRRAKVPKRLPRPLSDERLKRFFTSISTGPMRDKLLFILLIETGVRISEALGVKWGDLDLTPGRESMKVLGKGNKERLVPLHQAPVSLELLNKVIPGKDSELPIFVGRPGQALCYDQARELFCQYRDAAKLSNDVTIHMLRHTFATNLLEDGVNLLVAKELLGHADIKTTTQYQAVSDQLMRKELSKRRNRLTS